MKPLIILLFLLFLLPSTIISQTADDFISAPVPEDPNSNFSITGGKYKPSKNAEGEYLRILVTFVQFQGDNSAADDWTPNQLPGWAYSFLDTSPSGNYTDKTYSDYWNEMAVGDFDVIGNVFPELIILPPEETYANAGENFSHTNLDAIEEIDNWDPSEGSGSWNWTLYDNWEYDPGTQTFVFTAGNADGYVDMIFMIYRNATYYDPNDSTDFPGKWFGGGWGAFDGAATLGKIPFEYVTHDGLIVSSGNGWVSAEGSGITFRTGGPRDMRGVLGIMSHEYGHYLFGAGAPNYSGIMGGGTYAMNGWERLRVDQIEADFASSTGYESILGDFVTTGDVLKISVPFNNPNSTTYFLVENHQRTSSYDHIVRGGSIEGGYDYTGLGKGIYVYLIKNGNSYPGVLFEMLAADGYFDWLYVGDFWAGPGWYEGKPWEGWLPKTTRNAVNRNTGKNDRMPKHIYWNNHWAAKWVDINPLTKEWEITRNVMGDLTDAFNIGYNELLTRWSNPSSYVSGYGHTDISIQLLSESNGEITVKVFSNYNSARNLPPSKPYLGWDPRDLGIRYELGWIYLAWGADFWDGDPIEPDYEWSELQRKIGSGSWVTLYSGPNRVWSDGSVTYDPNGSIPVYFRVRVRDTQNLWSLWSDLYSTNMMNQAQEKYNSGMKSKDVPFTYSLQQNFPNPFNPTTQITYNIISDGFVSLKIYDVLGNEAAVLVNERQPAGTHSIEFNAGSLPSGIYFYTLSSGSFTNTKKLILLK